MEEDGVIFTKAAKKPVIGGGSTIAVHGLITANETLSVNKKDGSGALNMKKVTMQMVGFTYVINKDVPMKSSTITSNSARMRFDCKTLFKKVNPNRKKDSKDRTKFTPEELLKELKEKEESTTLSKGAQKKFNDTRKFLEAIPPTGYTILKPGHIVTFSVQQNGKDDLKTVGPGLVRPFIELMWEPDNYERDKDKDEKDKEKEKNESKETKEKNEDDEKKNYKLNMWPSTYFVDKMHPNCSGFNSLYLNDAIRRYASDAIRHSCAMGISPFPFFGDIKDLNVKFMIPLGYNPNNKFHDKEKHMVSFGVFSVSLSAYELKDGQPVSEVDVTTDKDTQKVLTFPFSIGVSTIIATVPDPGDQWDRTSDCRPVERPCAMRIDYFSPIPPRGIPKSTDDAQKKLGLYNGSMINAYALLCKGNDCWIEARLSRETPHAEVPEGSRFNSDNNIVITKYICPWGDIAQNWGVAIGYEDIEKLSPNFLMKENIESAELAPGRDTVRFARIQQLLANGGFFLNALYHKSHLLDEFEFYVVFHRDLLRDIDHHIKLVKKYAELKEADQTDGEDKDTWINRMEVLAASDKNTKLTTFENFKEFAAAHKIKLNKKDTYNPSDINEVLLANVPKSCPGVLIMACRAKQGVCKNSMLYPAHFLHYPENGIYPGDAPPFDSSFKMPVYEKKKKSISEGGSEDVDGIIEEIEESHDDRNGEASSHAEDKTHTKEDEKMDDTEVNSEISAHQDFESTSKYLAVLDGKEEKSSKRELEEDGMSDEERKEKAKRKKSGKKKAKEDVKSHKSSDLFEDDELQD